MSRIFFIATVVLLAASISPAFGDESVNEDGVVKVRALPSGVLQVHDSETEKFLTDLEEKKLPLPTQKSLSNAMARMSRVQIIDGGMLDGKPIDSGVLFNSSDPKVLAQLRALLEISEDSNSFGHDCCLGGPTLELYEHDKLMFCIGIHHGSTIRWKSWRTDAALRNPKLFIKWLAKHGASGPQDERTSARKQAEFDSLKEQQRRLDQFVSSMPAGLKTFFGPIHLGGDGQHMSFLLDDMSDKFREIPEGDRSSRALADLAVELPTKAGQILRLLEWAGTVRYMDAGEYRTYPVSLLLEYEPDTVLALVRSKKLSSAQWLGVSRYFSSLDFRDRFPYGYHGFDADLQRTIKSKIDSSNAAPADLRDFNDAVQEWMPQYRLERLIEEKKAKPIQSSKPSPAT